MRDEALKTARFDVEKMTCGKCRAKVEAALAEAPGVASAEVSVPEKSAVVHYDPALTGPEDIAAAITATGYPAHPVDEPLEEPSGETAPAAAEATAKATLEIEGMHCASCVSTVEKALAAVPGVASATVNLVTRKASVAYDPAATTPEALAEASARAGYPAKRADGPGETLLEIEGMHCASCVSTVEKALSAVPGVTAASVNLATRRASVTHGPGVSATALAEAAARAGYPATPVIQRGPATDHATDHDTDESRRLARRTALAALLAAPVFLAEMGGHLYPPLHHWIADAIGEQSFRVIQFLLTAAVLAGPGRVFFTAGIPALLRRRPEMNALVALGTAAAFGYSTVATFAPGVLPEGANHVYFEAAAVIVVLILLGRTLEARARGRAGAAIRGLMALAPDIARVETPEGVQERPIAAIATGDVLQLRPGERVAVDGRVIEGESWLDEAMITGEPVPVAKAPGDALVGGTVNGAGALRYEATAVGADTVLARIASMVEQAQAGKLPVQAVVDRITGWFVPAVIAVALVTVAAWLLATGDPARALVAGVAVLIIACPCAMGLATPVSILVATGRAAELGVLFRKGEALERLGAARVVAFDKTGTLTRGAPELTGIAAEGIAEDEALRLAAGAEARSEHPIARALTGAAEARGLALPVPANLTARPGYGITAEIEGAPLLIGAARLMRAEGAAMPPAIAEAAARYEAEGRSCTFLTREGRVQAVFAVSDPVKPGAAEALATLKARGLRLAMLSGDSPAAARAVAGPLGIDEVEAGLLPEDKLDRIAALKAHGPVAFVGDGINDAPALAAADLGLAIGTGTDVAIEAADVVLMGGRLEGVAQAHEISRRAMANIRQNLFWAFGYNVLLIPVAAGLLVPFGGPQLSPMLAAGAMALSSVFVVTNALRLRRAAR